MLGNGLTVSGEWRWVPGPGGSHSVGSGADSLLDREAQRAIRERHRLRTEQYEHEIRELKSKQPYQELQAVLRQKEAVEAELAEVKRCMAAIMAMVQPILAPPAGANAGAGMSASFSLSVLIDLPV